jgi:putative oxidoreductase
MSAAVAAVARARDRLLSLATRLSTQLAWLPPLLARVVLGVVFLRTGWGKLHSLDTVAQYFASLGIPAPALQAAVVAAVETVGGGLLLAGLGTRLAALPLAATMVVATATAQWPQAQSVLDLTATIELAYLALLVWLAQSGPGAASLDHLVTRHRRAR